jgi:RNA polymerase sigma-70 factor (ECF subfamily)
MPGRTDVSWVLDASSDNALVSGVGDQNREALAEIYRRHGGAVWAVAKRVCRNTLLAGEVCEAVFTELWSHRGRFDLSRGSLRSWLVAQAHARAVAAARDAARSEDARHRTGRDDQNDPTAPSADVEGTAHAAALAGEPRRAIDRLSTSERDAILLAYLGGHTCRETARLLGVSEGAVKSHIRRGLGNLRQTLGAQGVIR